MTAVLGTRERAPQVWRGYLALVGGREREHAGRNYSPNALLVLRWLTFRPGSTAELMGRVHERSTARVTRTLARLARLELVHSTRGGRFWLTAHGRELVELIDEEGII